MTNVKDMKLKNISFSSFQHASIDQACPEGNEELKQTKISFQD